MSRRSHHQSLTTVDVESAVLRRCQSPTYRAGPQGKAAVPIVLQVEPALNETQAESPTLSPSFGPISKGLVRVAATSPTTTTPAASPASSSSPVATSLAASASKRRESAPDLSGIVGSRPRIIIRLTSVDGLELNLTSPRQDTEEENKPDNLLLLLQPPSPEKTTPVCPVRSVVRCGAARRPPEEFLPSSKSSSFVVVVVVVSGRSSRLL